jgi:hypothetical protein
MFSRSAIVLVLAFDSRTCVETSIAVLQQATKTGLSNSWVILVPSH